MSSTTSPRSRWSIRSIVKDANTLEQFLDASRRRNRRFRDAITRECAGTFGDLEQLTSAFIRSDRAKREAAFDALFAGEPVTDPVRRSTRRAMATSEVAEIHALAARLLTKLTAAAHAGPDARDSVAHGAGRALAGAFMFATAYARPIPEKRELALSLIMRIPADWLAPLAAARREAPLHSE